MLWAPKTASSSAAKSASICLYYDVGCASEPEHVISFRGWRWLKQYCSGSKAEMEIGYVEIPM